MKRRLFLGHLGTAAGLAGVSGCALSAQVPPPGAAARFVQAVRGIEADARGRLGVSLLDTHTGLAVSYRGDERFPMCSTFKWVAAALVLSRVDEGHESLSRRVVFQAADVVDYSPKTAPRVGGDGMRLDELCDAAITASDNTAGNLLLASFGGPTALTAYFRSLGDAFSRLDRTEPTLNEARPSDERDTTTPDAMGATLQRVVLGTALSSASRAQIMRWLLANTTGDKRLRAGFPAGWRVADKTGTGAHGTNNHVAVVWPPGRAPCVVTAYLTQAVAPAQGGDAAIARVARAVVNAVLGKANPV